MSGHSKWSTIKHGKAIVDARRAVVFTKLSKEIIIAARQGGGDPDMNFRLRLAVQRAKDSNMPAANIERAIKRGDGTDGSAVQMEELTYEGYGPGGTAILLQALTDNKNRTVSEVRSTFTKIGGSMAEAGAVAWQFEQKGVVVVNADEDQADELTMVAIDAGADDIETVDTTLHAYSAPSGMEEIRRTLAESGAKIESSELAMVPKNTIELDEKTAMQALRLLDQLEELDDIQKVFSNADFPDEALAEYAKAE
jgi:YebC/PmpR family DNA-binding regulatory protein